MKSLKLFNCTDFNDHYNRDSYCRELFNITTESVDAMNETSVTKYWTLHKVGQGEDDDLNISEKKIDSKLADILAGLFPNITTLIIYFNFKTYGFLSELLSKFILP